jgi:hypothetical protein
MITQIIRDIDIDILMGVDHHLLIYNNKMVIQTVTNFNVYKILSQNIKEYQIK